MVSNKTGYWKFDVTNVFDTVSLSTYALQQTPFKFTPTKYKDLLYSDYYITWDFGDGSSNVNSLSTQHYYYYPGEYKVTMNIMLSSGNAVIDSYNRTVLVKDFVPNTFSFKQLESPNTTSISLTAGNYSPELFIERFNSLQSFNKNGYTFFLNVSGSNSLFYDKTKLETEPYSFLLPTHKFIQREVVGNVFSDTVVNKVKTTDTNLYGKLDINSLVVPASASDTNAFFVGTSGISNFYFVDDMVNNTPYYILCTIDTSNFSDNYTKIYKLPLLNLPIKNTFSSYYTINENIFKKADYFSITSNGLDGEGFNLDTFEIYETKFLNQKISFVAKLKYNTLYSSKNQYNKLTPGYNKFAINTIRIDLVQPSGELLGNIENYIKFDTTTYPDNNFGWIKGQLTIPNNNDLDDIIFESPVVQLSASGLVQDDSGGAYAVSGVSNKFRLYPSTGINKVAKINENFDGSGYMKSLAAQPSIYKKPILFDVLFSSMIGTLSSTPDALSKRVYEKTSNFINNNSNVDLCNIQSLYGFATEYNIDLNNYAKENFLINYPAEISRLVNIFSIKKSLLFGFRNKFNLNFKNKYNASKTYNSIGESTDALQDGKLQGVNRGKKLDIISDTITKTNDYIITRELYSDTYTLVRTNINSISLSTYPLSSFEKSWGWGLVLPDNLYNDSLLPYKLSCYYEFYEYINVVPGQWVDNIINWGDTYNTTVNINGDSNFKLSSTYLPSYLSSYNSTPLKYWDTYGGVIDQNIVHQLNLGLNLLSAK